MPGPISEFLAADHLRLDAILARSIAAPGGVDLAAFGAFREGLLRHIAMEEKILLPAARSAARGERLPHERDLRVQHGAIAALLVPTPAPELVGEIRKILAPHDALEEGEGGLYEWCDRRLSADAAALVERMRAYPPVKVARYQDGPRVCRTAEQALRVSALQAERRPRQG